MLFINRKKQNEKEKAARNKDLYYAMLLVLGSRNHL